MNSFRPRLTGTEMEWPVQVRQGDESFRQITCREIEQFVEHCRHPELKISEPLSLLSNGGRFYRDIGDHPEYATPEDDTFMGTVANEIAGERVVYDTLKMAKERNLFKDFILSKRVIDDEYRTWGYHMSFNADESIEIRSKALMPLGIHLATMNVYAGSGAVVPINDSRSMYVIGQKMLNLNTDFSQSSHDKEQPLVSLRNESLTDEDEYVRVHVTSMDASLSPWATWMKLGTISIVLRMMETQQLTDLTNFEDDMHDIAKRVSCDTSLSHTFRMENGKTSNALAVQSELVQRAKIFAKHGGLSDEESTVLAEWDRALTDLAQDPELLVDRVEWIARRRILRHYMGRHGLSLSDDIVHEKDRQWSYMGELGIGLRLRDTLWKQWMPPDEQIEHAYLHPPASTRAFARGALIRQYAQSLDANLMAFWHTATVATDKARTVYSLNDPYSPIAKEVIDASDDEAEDDTDRYVEYLLDDGAI